MAQITIPDQLAARLEEMAREQGLSLIDLLREFAGQRAPSPDATTEQRRAARRHETNKDTE